ncbi:hypothetical protein, partial [uncultured Selenomonas sp.]|uniref:hypothetical protein n=1 Tax=uncultured Selenomonas sp. TaxID=159275 RepID=UPI0025F70164
MKKICQVFFVLLMFLVCSSSVGSAEHWISMTNPVNGAQGFFDGDSAWFDSISRDGGVKIKIPLGLSIVLCKFFSQPCRTYASRPTCAHPFRVGYA